jgi:retinol dehydrogenase-12
MITLLLLPIMVKTAKEFGTQPRITFTSSEMHNTTAGDVKPEAQATPAILEKMSDKSFCTPKSVVLWPYSTLYFPSITNVRLSMYVNRVMSARYPETKLLNVQFVRGLTARLPSSTPIVVTSVNPGFCHSELVRNMKGIVRVVVTIIQALLARSTEIGSRTLVWAALAGLDGSVASW